MICTKTNQISLDGAVGVLELRTMYSFFFTSEHPCGIIPNPDNGLVNQTAKVAIFSCDPGYQLQGTSPLQCLLNSQNAEWNDTIPRCIADLSLSKTQRPSISNEALGQLDEYTTKLITATTNTSSKIFPSTVDKRDRNVLLTEDVRQSKSTAVLDQINQHLEEVDSNDHKCKTHLIARYIFLTHVN